MVENAGPGPPVGEFFDDLFKQRDTVVGRCIIHEDELHFPQCLREQVAGAAFDEGRYAVNRNDSRYFYHWLI